MSEHDKKDGVKGVVEGIEHRIEDGVKGTVDEIEHFFLETESLVEKIIFGKRLWILLAFLLITVYLVSAAIKVRPDASFEKMVPSSTPILRLTWNARKS